MSKRVTKDKWLELCKTHKRWVSWEEVKGFSELEAEQYILLCPLFVPMFDVDGD